MDYNKCELCPNMCQLDRTKHKGMCGETSTVRVAWSGLHRGEEPPISGKYGSGMIFFTGCPLHCAYCQNHQISIYDSPVGVSVSIDELAHLMLSLQEMKATTLNLVTGTHFIPSIVSALKIATSKGFSLPVVWNSSGYENPSALALIDPYIDLYLVDVKSLDKDVCSVFCGKREYADAIIPTMEFIMAHKKRTSVENLKGTLVRHLVFPGTLRATLRFLEWYSKRCMRHCSLSLMVQFIPPLEKDRKFEAMSDEEYEVLLDALDVFGIEDGFVQERGDDILWVPDFREDVPFPASFADANPYFLSLKREKAKLL